MVRQPELLVVTSDVRRRDNGDQIHMVRVSYTVEQDGGELTHELDGTTDRVGWFALDDLETMHLADYAHAAIGAAQAK